MRLDGALVKVFRFKKIAIVTILAVGLISFYHFIDGQFRLQNIQDNVIGQQDILRDHNPSRMSLENEQNLLQSILAQPYRYLDRGRQSFVFASQDGRYVIKFFDLRRYRSGIFTPFSLSRQARMKRKKDRLFRGYKLAYEQDGDHAFILYQQLIPNPLLKQSIVLYDWFGFKHTIDLGQVAFIIQSRAVPTRVEITKLLSQGDIIEAKKRLRQVLDMYVIEYGRAIYDRDHNFMYNTGFVDGKSMRLDVGRLRADERYKDPRVALEDLEKIAIDRTEGWLLRHFPQYRDEIIADMHLKMGELRDGIEE